VLDAALDSGLRLNIAAFSAQPFARLFQCSRAAIDMPLRVLDRRIARGNAFGASLDMAGDFIRLRLGRVKGLRRNGQARRTTGDGSGASLALRRLRLLSPKI
jgi:hypothetical protein